MLALWLVFLYFAFFDCRFKGSLGKRLLGLTVVGVETNKLSFRSSFARNFLSLPLPVICGVLLNHWIIGEGHSPVRLFVGDALKNAVVSFVPMSIMFFEGNQSIADRLTSTAIRAEHEATNLVSTISPKAWTLLFVSNLTWALLYASLFYVAVFKPMLGGPSKQLQAGAESAWWTAGDPKQVAALWTILPGGMKEPTLGIRAIQFLEVSPSPFSFQADESHFRPPLDPGPYLKMVKEMPVVRVTLTGHDALQVKLLVVENLLTHVGRTTPIQNRPALAVLQIATDKKFGLFSIRQQENILLCWMASANKAVDFYTDVRPRGSIQFPVSLDEIGFLLVGAGVAYW